MRPVGESTKGKPAVTGAAAAAGASAHANAQRDPKAHALGFSSHPRRSSVAITAGLMTASARAYSAIATSMAPDGGAEEGRSRPTRACVTENGDARDHNTRRA